jgi:hypothetical protein
MIWLLLLSPMLRRRPHIPRECSRGTDSTEDQCDGARERELVHYNVADSKTLKRIQLVAILSLTMMVMLHCTFHVEPVAQHNVN